MLKRLGVSPRGCSRRLERALRDFGADEAFAPAAEKVREHYGVEVNGERVRQVCLRHARRMAEARPRGPCTRLASQGPEWIVVEADGTMLPRVDTAAAPPGQDRRKHRTVRWQEARVLAAQALGETTTHYEATLGEVAEAGALWSQAARCAGWGANTHTHAVGDGAAWLAQQASERFGSNSRYLLDLYHVCDHLTAVWPGERTVVHGHRDALKTGPPNPVLQALRERLEPPATPEADAPARCALRYLTNRIDQLDYPHALRHGLPVGSGLIESSHRHLLQSRLKLAGAWCSPSNAHSMIQLRVTRANSLWLSYWHH
jgi:hypothetical protein